MSALQKQSSSAVLFRVADHWANVVSVRGPPNFFPYFLGNFLFHFSGTSTEIFIKFSADRFF